MQFFYWVSKRHFYKHDRGVFVAMLDRLVRDEQFVNADHVRILLIKSCRNAEDVRWVFEYLSGLRKKGLDFSLYSCSALLIQFGKFDMVDAAKNFYLELLSSGIQPSLLTLNTMNNMLCTERKGSRG